MKYTINNIVINDKTNSYEHILKDSFLKQNDKNKLIFITDNIKINYNDNISLKYNKIKDFLLKNELIKQNISNSITDKFIIKLLTKLIYDYGYLLK